MTATLHTRMLGRKVELTLEQYGQKFYVGRIVNVYMSERGDSADTPRVLYDVEVDGDPESFIVVARRFYDGPHTALRMKLSAK